MSLGHRGRAESFRVDNRSGSGVMRSGSSLTQLLQSGCLPFSGQQTPAASSFCGCFLSQRSLHSPNSSRDTSPFSRPASGLFQELQLTSNTSFSDTPSTGPEVTAQNLPKLEPMVGLESLPSLGYELGKRALWLDRHSSLKAMASRSEQRDDEEPNCFVEASRHDCIKYCSSWAISQSLVWRLAEEYVQGHPAPQEPKPSELQPKDTTEVTALPSPPIPPLSTRPPPGATFSAKLPPLLLPFGIGSVGLTSPVQNRLKRAALTALARSRMELRRGWSEAQLELHGAEAGFQDSTKTIAEAEAEVVEQQLSEAVVSAAGAEASSAAGSGTNAPPATSAATGISITVAARNQRPHSQLHERDLRHRLADALVEAVATCPASQQVVRRRVRALVAGLSVAYTAANLGTCAAALLHADFSHDFANSAKAVLDFVLTALSVTGIAADLIHIGVAVGLCVAQRRTLDL